jgi:hypothetical protein
MTNRISPPNVKVTLSGIIYDVFWQFAPLTYSESYQEPYNEALKEWLNQCRVYCSQFPKKLKTMF